VKENVALVEDSISISAKGEWNNADNPSPKGKRQPVKLITINGRKTGKERSSKGRQERKN